MRLPRLPWKKNDYGTDTADVEIAGLWMYAMVRPFAANRWNWRVTVCGLTSDGQSPSRASAMRAVRDRLRNVHQFLNAWGSP